MNAQDTAIFESGQRVGLTMLGFGAELADFAPLAAANTEREALVAAIAAREQAQDTITKGTTTTKEEAREAMAVATATLSARAASYALATKQLGLKQAVTLSYADVRYGDADEDVHHVRTLVALVRSWPAAVRTSYRLSAAVIEAAEDAAEAFEQAGAAQTVAKELPVLATLALPELLRRLSAALLLMKTLIAGQRTDQDPAFRWAELDVAFRAANKRRQEPKQRRPAVPGTRIVRTLPLTSQDAKPVRLANTNYGPAYTLTVENRSAGPLRLWMAQRDGAPTTPGVCLGGAVAVLTRADIGPETARYLTAQFDDPQGGAATVVVRRVV